MDEGNGSIMTMSTEMIYETEVNEWTVVKGLSARYKDCSSLAFQKQAAQP